MGLMYNKDCIISMDPKKLLLALKEYVMFKTILSKFTSMFSKSKTETSFRTIEEKPSKLQLQIRDELCKERFVEILSLARTSLVDRLPKGRDFKTFDLRRIKLIADNYAFITFLHDDKIYNKFKEDVDQLINESVIIKDALKDEEQYKQNAVARKNSEEFEAFLQYKEEKEAENNRLAEEALERLKKQRKKAEKKRLAELAKSVKEKLDFDKRWLKYLDKKEPTPELFKEFLIKKEGIAEDKLKDFDEKSIDFSKLSVQTPPVFGEQDD